jgi:hypothetical protein
MKKTVSAFHLLYQPGKELKPMSSLNTGPPWVSPAHLLLASDLRNLDTGK